MLTTLTDPQIPQVLRDVLLIDDRGLPRYWSTVWALLTSAELAKSSQLKRLRYVESLYVHADQSFGPNSLDDALGDLDDHLLGAILESWFVSIRNQPAAGPADEARWRTGHSFVTAVVTWLTKSAPANDRLRQLDTRLHRLSNLYGQLHVRRARSGQSVRSLPSNVVAALYELLDPSSGTNPFPRARTRWQVFVVFLLLLHQGLRRGELLLLTVDAVKSGFDNRLQRDRCWLNVRSNRYDDDGVDPRYSTPSIKSANSVRQVPVSDAIAGLVQSYTENYRGKANHPFLLNTQRGSPLSTESLTKVFEKISAALPRPVVKELADRTGRETVTPHDLVTRWTKRCRSSEHSSVGPETHRCRPAMGVQYSKIECPQYGMTRSTSRLQFSEQSPSDRLPDPRWSTARIPQRPPKFRQSTKLSNDSRRFLPSFDTTTISAISCELSIIPRLLDDSPST